MKLLSVISLLLSLSVAHAQEDSVTFYHWNDLPSEFDPDTIVAISFSKMKLSELPDELSRFKHLQYLKANKNKLENLPDFIGDFKDLRFMDLTKNKFIVMPIEVCRMKSLTHLLLGSNNIGKIPDCIQYAQQLQYMDFYDNPLKSLPESLVNLTYLETLDLNGIMFSQPFQDKWSERMPNVNFNFEPPCDCF